MKPADARPSYLLISAHHDYRTARRSNVHFIADELAKRGTVRFFSMRYSPLSKPRGDIRLDLDARANRVETQNGVECFLWKTRIHPVNLHSRWLRPLESLLFGIYRNTECPTLAQWIREADVIIYESGIAPLHFDHAKRLNREARHIYLCNDALEAIDAASFALRTLARVAPQMDAVVLVARAMAQSLPPVRAPSLCRTASTPRSKHWVTPRPTARATMWCRSARCCLTRTFSSPPAGPIRT
jgi:2-beta-glucuronyltransferase